MQSPTIKEIKTARIEAGLTQKEAGQLIHYSARTWEKWEAGARAMTPAAWELFKMKSQEIRRTRE